ncbi:phenoloxidase-activating factor 3 isoform X3 [Plutella xylostella]|uniref:phenoloxidase-activating factor 3 isoform X3 n=1 Tax=Plutella xylostella TaxID=51655 RepID=UPI0005D08400|nr:phenoloxidase-activating factor 3 isoform X3 [Plutella xylostella]
MKVLAIALLCAFASVQGRSTSRATNIADGTPAALGENPSVVHLRVARNGDTRLASCGAVLVSDTYILTTKTCLEKGQFIWMGFGLVETTRPEQVLEAGSGTITLHPDEKVDLALIRSARAVDTSDNIQIASMEENLGSDGRACGFGASESDPEVAGETLKCVEIEDMVAVGETINAPVVLTKFDLGQPLFSVDGELAGVLIDPTQGVYIRPNFYLDWINEVINPGGNPDPVSEVLVANP